MTPVEDAAKLGCASYINHETALAQNPPRLDAFRKTHSPRWQMGAQRRRWFAAAACARRYSLPKEAPKQS
jgi:hypothetical protein